MSNEYETKSNANLLGFTEAIKLIDQGVADSGHHLYIKLKSLAHPLFSNQAFIKTLKDKLVNSNKYSCQILLEDIRPSKSNSDFVRYYQRLTDYIEIRRFSANKSDADRRQYIVIDKDMVMWQNYDQNNDMRLFTDAHRVDDFTTAFENSWAASERDLSLLKLYI